MKSTSNLLPFAGTFCPDGQIALRWPANGCPPYSAGSSSKGVNLRRTISFLSLEVAVLPLPFIRPGARAHCMKMLISLRM